MTRSSRLKSLVGGVLLFYLVSVWHQMRTLNTITSTITTTSTSTTSPPKPTKKKRKGPTTVIPQTPQETPSSVDYFACCGLGHRLVRMAGAYLLAKHVNMELRSFWGFCGTTEVFSHFFPSFHSGIKSLTQNEVLAVYSDVKPGFRMLQRGNYTITRSSRQECPCQNAQEHAGNAEFYRNLRAQYRFRTQVEEFRSQQFTQKTVLGMHIRAGNGETGDFLVKKRQIQDTEQWLEQLVGQLRLLMQRLEQQQRPPPILFLATDTPSMAKELQTRLEKVLSKLPMIQWEGHAAGTTSNSVALLKEGQGVAFGEQDHVHMKRNPDQCLTAWQDAMTELFLLSHTDIVIAARASSFVQSAPLSIALDTTSSTQEYCELVQLFDEDTKQSQHRLDCYSTFHQWCCQAAVKGQESLLLWDDSVEEQARNRRRRIRSKTCEQPPRGAKSFVKYCIPHSWVGP